jgi:hypothetical protein
MKADLMFKTIFWKQGPLLAHLLLENKDPS